MLERLRRSATALKNEIRIFYLALRDPRTPWYAKALIFLVITYALSPIDLIPDFIPIIGALDDLIIVPAGLVLASKLVPRVVIDDARKEVLISPQEIRRVGWIGAFITLLVWLIMIGVVIWFLMKIRKTL